MRFLVTRPQPDCKRTADKLRAAGHTADEAPLLETRTALPERFDLSDVKALAVSSRRTISVLTGHPQFSGFRKLPVFTVGKASAAACEAAGFKDVSAADGDVEALAKLMLETRSRLKPGTVLYPAAEDRAGDLEGLLAAGGVSCRTLVVYRMEHARELPAGVVRALAGSAYDGVLVYSKRTAEALLELLKAHDLLGVCSGVPVYAISQQVAGPLSKVMPVRVADAPCEQAVLDLVLAEC